MVKRSSSMSFKHTVQKESSYAVALLWESNKVSILGVTCLPLNPVFFKVVVTLRLNIKLHLLRRLRVPYLGLTLLGQPPHNF
jgi:hypothetical protein